MEDLWRTRFTWAALGSAATVAVIRLSTPAPVVQAPVDPRTQAETAPPSVTEPTSLRGAAAEPPTRAAQPAPTPEPAPTAERAPAAPPMSEPSPASAATATEAPTADPTAQATPEPSATVAPGVVPRYPFPRMPGMRTLRRSERFDDELGRWVLTRAQRVPAPLFAVESFYTKAFKDYGMSVSRLNEPVDANGTRRVTIRARNKLGKAQVAIRQPADELQTTARIIWQTDPAPG